MNLDKKKTYIWAMVCFIIAFICGIVIPLVQKAMIQYDTRNDSSIASIMSHVEYWFYSSIISVVFVVCGVFLLLISLRKKRRMIDAL